MKEKNIYKTLFFIVTAIVGLLGVVSILGFATFNTLVESNGKIVHTGGSKAPLVVMLIFLFSIFGVLACIGSAVYKDAKKLGMNAWMWVLITVYVPYFIGLIVYLIIRHGEKNRLKCSACGEKVDMNFSICPKCGNKLKDKCSGCQKYVSDEWKVCPYCGKQLK